MYFDTTYNTDDYGLQFVPIVCVNNHKQIIFLSPLLSHEMTETFVCMFKNFLKTMEGKVMDFIFTERAGGIVNVIKKVMRTVHYRLCI